MFQSYACPHCGKPESSFDGEHFCGKCEQAYLEYEAQQAKAHKEREDYLISVAVQKGCDEPESIMWFVGKHFYDSTV